MKVRLALAALAVVLALVSTPPAAHAYPSGWSAQARCIHFHETRRPWSRGWHLTRTWLGAPSTNRGGMQIAESTWRAHVPRGWTLDPAKATRAQQLLVSWRIYTASGRSWRQWSTSGSCT